MHVVIHSSGTNAMTGKRAGVLRFTGLVVAAWVLGGVWATHFILAREQGTVTIIVC